MGRDPRIEPRVGDIFQNADFVGRVFSSEVLFGEHVVQVEELTRHMGWISVLSLREFRQKSCGATIIHVAEG